jgi:hypothetical protein
LTHSADPKAESQSVSASTLTIQAEDGPMPDAPADRPATIYDVAALAKLSIATVSRVLQGSGPQPAVRVRPGRLDPDTGATAVVADSEA